MKAFKLEIIVFDDVVEQDIENIISNAKSDKMVYRVELLPDKYVLRSYVKTAVDKLIKRYPNFTPAINEAFGDMITQQGRRL